MKLNTGIPRKVRPNKNTTKSRYVHANSLSRNSNLCANRHLNNMFLTYVRIYASKPDCMLLQKDEKEPPETYIVQRYIENPYLIGGKHSICTSMSLFCCYYVVEIWLKAVFIAKTLILFSFQEENLTFAFMSSSQV